MLRRTPAEPPRHRGSLALSITATPTRIEFDRAVEEAVDDLGFEYDDSWFCVRTAPFPCPAEGCGFIAEFLTAAHHIIVWPRKDDRDLLRIASDARQFGRDPQVIAYERGFGACLSFDAWLALGRPVHGQNPRPDDQPFRSF